VPPRQIEIDSPTEPGIDARSVILGFHVADGNEEAKLEQPQAPAVVWKGSVRSETNADRSYFVVIYDDATARCSCPDFHFRGVLRDDRRYACKHIRGAHLRLKG
jgi:hypothetical protein